MSINRSLLPLAAISLAVAGLTAGCNKKAGAPEKEQTAAENGSDVFPDWGTDSAPAPQGKVDPAAVQAITDMSKYLSGLNSFKAQGEGSLDAVTADGQRIQMDGSTDYTVSKKGGFAIDYRSDKKNRDFFYDGKQFTVYSPNLNYYATVPAPGTIPEVLDMIYDKYGIRLPMEDLFRWDDPDNAKRKENFRSAFNLGTVTLDGVKTTHYAFREPDVDWEIWIQDGDKPLPRKLSIVDRTDPARPAFTTRLNWTPNAPVNASEFTFKPGPNDQRINLAQYKG